MPELKRPLVCTHSRCAAQKSQLSTDTSGLLASMQQGLPNGFQRTRWVRLVRDTNADAVVGMFTGGMPAEPITSGLETSYSRKSRRPLSPVDASLVPGTFLKRFLAFKRLTSKFLENPVIGQVGRGTINPNPLLTRPVRCRRVSPR
jgi:hypothetical protein